MCLFTSYLCDQTTVYMEGVCEWLLLNANLAIVQLYHGANKLIFNEVAFVLDQHALCTFYSASSLKQQSGDRHVVPLGHIILIPGQPIFALCFNAVCLAEKLHIPIA